MQYQLHRELSVYLSNSPLLFPYPISPVVSPAHSLTVEHTPPEAETVKPRKAHAPQHPTGALTIGTNRFMENVILTVFNYAQNNREQFLLIKLFEIALKEEVE